MKKLRIALTLTCCVLGQTAHAGLLQSTAIENSFFGGGIVAGGTIESESNSIDRTLMYSYETNYGQAYNQVWAGASMGGGNGQGNGTYGGIGTRGQFTIDDIVISYTGSDTLESNMVEGSVHTTNYVNVIKGFSPTGVSASSFNLGLRVQGSYYSIEKKGESLIDNLFAWNINKSFLLNDPFSLYFSSALSASVFNYTTEGYYKSSLGGSPVFILPDGFSANSADGTIVDNYYMGYNPLSVNTTQVPEPPTSILLLLAAGIFFFQLKKVNLEEKK